MITISTLVHVVKRTVRYLDTVWNKSATEHSYGRDGSCGLVSFECPRHTHCDGDHDEVDIHPIHSIHAHELSEAKWNVN